MPRKPTKPTPESGKKLYGIRFQSAGPSEGIRFNLPKQPDRAVQANEVMMEDLVRETAEESGQTEETIWKFLRAGATVFNKKNVGLGQPLSLEEGSFLLLLVSLGVKLTVEEMQELIHQIRTGPVDRFFPLEEVTVN